MCVLSCSVMSDSCNPTDCSPPGSSVHGTLQARILEWVGILLGIFPTQGPNMGLPHCGQILYPLSHLRSSGNQNSLLAWPMSPGGRAPQFRTTGLGEREGTQCLVGLQTWVVCLELKDVGVGMFLASISDLAASTDAARREGGARVPREKNPRGRAGRSRKAPSDPCSPAHCPVISALPAETRPYQDQRPGQ